MDTFMPLLLPLLLLPLSLYLIISVRKRSSDDLKNLPPGSKGWPIIGENVEFALSGSEQFIENRMEKYSPEVFKTSLVGETTAVLCGAQGNKFVFTNENKLVTVWYPRSLRKVMFQDYDERSFMEPLAISRNCQRDLLNPEALRQHIAVMDALARELLEKDSWRPNSVVKAFPSANKYTFELSFRVFLKVVDPERVHRLLDPFTVLVNGLVSLPIDLPGTAFNRAIRAGKEVRGELLRIVEERRKENKESGGRGDDLLSKMLVATDARGQYLRDAAIVNNLVGFLLASHVTNASAVTAVLSFLAQLPHIYDQVSKEQMEIAKAKGPHELLTWEDVDKMSYTWNVVRESLRLLPPSRGAFRETTTEFTYAGFTIPKGWKIFWTVHSSHKNPDYFPEPEKFDPSRFEGSGPAPYAYVPFGGGPRMCPGRGYSKLVILAFIHNVVTRFRLEKVIPTEKMLFHVTPTPAHGLPLHLHPLTNSNKSISASYI